MYVTKTNVYEIDQFTDALYTNNLFKTNIKELKGSNNQFNQTCFFAVEDYINDYSNNLKDIERTYSNRKNIRGFIVEVAFSKKYDIRKWEIENIIKLVIDYIAVDRVIPYIALWSNGRIIIMMFDRYFYPTGKVVDIIAKSDYQNGIKRGQVVRQERRYLSDKIRIFNFATEKQLSMYFEILRNVLNDNMAHMRKFSKVSNKKLKKVKGSFVKLTRKDTFYNLLDEWRMRKIRAYNGLLAMVDLGQVNIAKEVLEGLKDKINSKYSVFQFEQDIIKLLS